MRLNSLSSGCGLYLTHRGVRIIYQLPSLTEFPSNYGPFTNIQAHSYDTEEVIDVKCNPGVPTLAFLPCADKHASDDEDAAVEECHKIWLAIVEGWERVVALGGLQKSDLARQVRK